MVKKIVVTNEKGGTGKSTITCLLTDYLNFLGKKVQIIDTDPLQASQHWVNNCREYHRLVSSLDSEYQIIDTAGSSGSALSHLRAADWILVPFQANYVDLRATIDWYDSLRDDWKGKTIFIVNRWQNTIEQRDGLNQLKNVLSEDHNHSLIIDSKLANRPAFYGSLLGGQANNLFTQKNISKDLWQLMEQLWKLIK